MRNIHRRLREDEGVKMRTTIRLQYWPMTERRRQTFIVSLVDEEQVQVGERWLGEREWGRGCEEALINMSFLFLFFFIFQYPSNFGHSHILPYLILPILWIALVQKTLSFIIITQMISHSFFFIFYGKIFIHKQKLICSF